jgi:hypothetical protein
VNFYLDTFSGLTNPNYRPEVENNGNFANATLFTPGQNLRGTISSTSDNDNFKFNAVQGNTYVFFVDSVRTSTFKYTLRLFCPNDTTVLSRLAMSSDGSSSSSTNVHALIVWTAPTTNTYYLRMTPSTSTGGYIAILPYLDEHWKTFCEAAGRPELATDPRFRSLGDRIENIDIVYRQTGEIMAQRTTAEWFAVLGGTKVPVMIVNSLEDLITDEHLTATGFWQDMDHPTEGRLRLPGVPVTFSETPGAIRRHPPRLGEHSAEVLREAGYSESEIAAMVASGATLADSSRL